MLKKSVVALFILTMSCSAWATKQTYKVTATVSNVSEWIGGALPAPLQIGDQVTMTYVMDDSKIPVNQNNTIEYDFYTGNEGSIQVAWSSATLKTRQLDSQVIHRLTVSSGIEHYEVMALNNFENTGNTAQDVQAINLDLHSNGPYQSYTPWEAPDLTKFSGKSLNVSASGYWFSANITSIVKEPTQPFTIWPEQGKMHVSQTFDLFVTAPAGFYTAEFFSGISQNPLMVGCDIAPILPGESDAKLVCRNLDSFTLGLDRPDYNGVTIKLRNMATGATLQRVIDWQKVN